MSNNMRHDQLVLDQAVTFQKKSIAGVGVDNQLINTA